MVLTGTTTAIAGSPEIYTYTPTRSIRIEATPTAGVLSLTPAEIATLHADADRDMVLHTLNGDITVASALAGNQINSGYLNLKAPGGNITVDAPITGGSGMGGMFIQAGQNVTINAPVDAGAGMIIVQTLGDNQLFTLTGSGSLTSTYSGPIMPDACGNSVAICVNSGRMTIDGTITANNQAVLLATGTDRAVVLGVDDNQCRQHRRRHPGADQRRTESNSRQHLGGCQRLHEWSRQ
jgi:hypothetical protein